ncbi:hypothetical protein TrCOL_g6626 [Triparma columacea]|uniref:Uncharacterized protein n=1 Tax=Triparma columacea TaxID=722753 RepID=A0A9W7G0U0_9STRA|nr:hypothetical protein TrCOL_g6626 [Triparma columacea]
MGQKSDSMLFLSLRRSRYKIFLLALLSCTVLVMLYHGGSVPLNPAPTGHGQGSAMWSGSASESASIDSADNTANVNCMYRWKDISALLASCSRETERDTCSRETERDRGAGVEGKTVPQTDKVYHSSAWERLWIDNIKTWQNHQICEALAQQQDQLKKFMSAMCSASTDTSWCLVDDTQSRFWYNTQTGEMNLSRPSSVTKVGPLGAVSPVMDPTIFSRFEWNDIDGTPRTEFIEPLVSHLRHPLAGCSDALSKKSVDLIINRSYIVPPPKVSKGRKFYFDAGASSWGEGAGGPSLSYFTKVWERHGIEFNRIDGWEGSTSKELFYCTVPNKYLLRTYFNQQWIASSVESSGVSSPFVPTVIRETTSKDDYVLFKLDIDSPAVETGTVDYLLSPDNDDLEYIDEFIWEHHVDNYIMQPFWGKAMDKTMTIADSYEYFLRLRRQGVRAHSWV